MEITAIFTVYIWSILVQALQRQKTGNSRQNFLLKTTTVSRRNILRSQGIFYDIIYGYVCLKCPRVLRCKTPHIYLKFAPPEPFYAAFDSCFMPHQREKHPRGVLAVEQYEIENTYRQEKDEKLLKFLVLFSWQALLLCPQKLFWFCRYAVALLGSIYLPCSKFDMFSLCSNSIWYKSALTQWAYRVRQHISNALAYIENPH